MKKRTNIDAIAKGLWTMDTPHTQANHLLYRDCILHSLGIDLFKVKHLSPTIIIQWTPKREKNKIN